MKVKVIKLEIDNIDKSIINSKMQSFLKIGDEYTVYALTIQKAATYVQINLDNKLISIPLELFEIIDSRVSKYWSISFKDSSIFFWPNEFYQGYFHDDLFEGVPQIVSLFNEIKDKLEIEFW